MKLIRQKLSLSNFENSHFINMKFPEYKNLDLSAVSKNVLKEWQENKTFEKSLKTRKGNPAYVFYEGPPSANGLPGIHHVMARTIKDLFCRYKTQQGFYVERKAGWDTHGLPVELGVEKKLGITKEDIGKSISIEEYNDTCRKEVMQYTDIWEDITDKMGYWVDMNDPYITYDNKYIETLWHLLKELYNKKLLYKGYSIQPFSPAAGTGLSSHELNLPGCYRDVKDTTAVAMFKVVRNEQSEKLFADVDTDVSIMAWTTTPWTLLSNTALTINQNIDYVKVSSFNPYTSAPITVILAKARLENYFSPKNAELALEDYKEGDKKIPFKVLSEFKGKEIVGCDYEQLLPYQQPVDGDAFKVISGDFVTTEDGTGVVHTAPSFGADDFRVCKANGIGSLTLVDKTGKVVDGVGEFSGKYVKNAYDESLPKDAESLDLQIAVKLKLAGKAFKVEKYVHSYPHCWRTDKPVLYYPLDSWFVKTTEYKERMLELNNTINWKPAATGTGRFGKWLENLVDWNLSRSRYWGTPLPIWRTEDGEEEICIGSAEELKKEAQKAVEAGLMDENPLNDFTPGDFSKENYLTFDLHKSHVDKIILISPSGKPMQREADLIDVWFDSGAMPYAQQHYPFENKDKFAANFPADFIAEGVDQTRGWFFTLHAISTMLFDSVAFKNIVSNGLVLDKNGQKMSKRLGNGVDPFKTIEKYGADPTRWYMVTNASPWDNLKFDVSGIEEVSRKFFGTLYNTYSFFSLYANIDNFDFSEPEIPMNQRPEIDRWVISLLNTLVQDVTNHYENYEPTKVGRAIQDFVSDNLSNWYVRLNRKRFWGEEYSESKIAAYQTLYTCLITVTKLSAPIAPFFMDSLYQDLNAATGKEKAESVHLSDFPKADDSLVDEDLEERMDLAQRISSMILGLRRKVSLKVRQPLSKIMIPDLDDKIKAQVNSIKDIVLSEVNIKDIEFISDAAGILTKKIKPNFKLLGRKFGKFMKDISKEFSKLRQEDIAKFEKDGKYRFDVNNEAIEIQIEEAEISSEDIPGWLAANDGRLTVALDVNITEELRQEGIARELVNRIQNLRKSAGLNVTDKINLQIKKHERINLAIENFKKYIAGQTLASNIELVDNVEEKENYTDTIEIEENVVTQIKIDK